MGPVCDLAFTDEAEGPADRDVAFVAEARDGDVHTRLAVGRRSSLGELQRPAGVGVLLRYPGGFVGPDIAGFLALLNRILLNLSVALLGRRNQGGINDLPAHREITAVLQLPVKIGKQHL